MSKFKLKNKKIIATIITLVFLVILGTLCLIFHLVTKPQTTLIRENIETPNLNTETNIEANQPKPVETVLEINGIKYEDTITGKTSVYDFMSQLRKEGKINFVEENYIGMGKFIESINGVVGNENDSWIYYVNGVEAKVGVSNYKINPGDVVSWKYEKSDY
jgi:uncharacterized protein YpmB